MGIFRWAVSLMMSFICIQPGLLFIISFLSSPAFSRTSQTLPPVSSCDADLLRQRISVWQSYLVMMIVCSLLVIQFVRVIVESGAQLCALRMCRHANMMVWEEEPNHGIDCIARWEGIVVRPCFCLAIAFSLGSAVCAIVALDLSLKVKFGCVNGSAEIIQFAVVGVMAILFHGFLGWVAITQD